MTIPSRSKRKSTAQPSSRGNSSLYWLVGGSIVMIGLIVFAIILNTGGTGGPIPQPELPAEWIDGMSLGDPEAPVVVEAFEDFLCSHCREWTDSVEAQMRSTYIPEGQVRFVYRTFPLDGFAPGSRMAAQGAYCAAAQNYFWPYHDRLFSVQNRGQSAYMIEELIDYAGTLGLNEREFTQCMSAMTNTQDIADTVQEGVSRGVTGTPSVFINGENVSSDWATVQSTIDGLLAAN